MEFQNSAKVVGRYAPSPTGELHLGNLRTALIAWLHARLNDGVFKLRMEDLDQPRVVNGSDAMILRDLETLGIDWDGEVLYQSTNTERYQYILDELSSQNKSYPCFCSRKDIVSASSAPHSSPSVYPGTCANLTPAQVVARESQKRPSIRVRVDNTLEADCGDFVIHRADGLYAYQLAVVVDDHDQRISHVVRGADLHDSTPRQLFMASLLFPQSQPINYLHAPLMTDESGRKLSKRDGSQSLTSWLAEGKTVNQLIGEFASQLGLLPEVDVISAEELLESLRTDSLDDVLVS